MIDLGRNAPCHCGSGKKYKRCHLASDEQQARAALAAEAAADGPEAWTEAPPLPLSLSELPKDPKQWERFQEHLIHNVPPW